MQWEHWARMEALELESIELLQAQAVEAEDSGCWTLDTLLGLAVASMPPTAQPPPIAPQGPWVSESEDPVNSFH
ncbi:hypothetical protein Y1Q_0019349 [Alligator mississippiensis]|uniref:Uncharacterized protein n=1 Tax=Alligator mississippiensis TaxID=8496 RepID=A0A151MR89_ALLMI|nr:hypothetical protein Y1Q_0019349 [Alligator mississippiensis]